jgi:hypothetical protein
MMTYEELKNRCEAGEVTPIDYSCPYESQGLEGTFPDEFVKKNPKLFEHYEVQIDIIGDCVWIYDRVLRKGQ